MGSKAASFHLAGNMMYVYIYIYIDVYICTQYLSIFRMVKIRNIFEYHSLMDTCFNPTNKSIDHSESRSLFSAPQGA